MSKHSHRSVSRSAPVLSRARSKRSAGEGAQAPKEPLLTDQRQQFPQQLRSPQMPKLILLPLLTAALALSQTQPLLPENATKKVSDHVYVIQGWPNVGIIVGERATLVVDTGLGPRNGALVA